MSNHHFVQVRIAGVFGALAVILGACGAHGSVHNQLIAKGADHLADWQTAAHYHLLHAAVLLALGLANVSRWGFRSILLGTTLFSGSIYLLSLDCFKSVIWPLTPIGGLFLIVGWLLVAFRK